MICYKCKKQIINEKTAVGCIVEDFGIGGRPASNVYLCFECYQKEMEQHKKDISDGEVIRNMSDMKDIEEREKNGEIFF